MQRSTPEILSRSCLPHVSDQSQRPPGFRGAAPPHGSHWGLQEHIILKEIPNWEFKLPESKLSVANSRGFHL